MIDVIKNNIMEKLMEIENDDDKVIILLSDLEKTKPICIVMKNKNQI